MRIASTSIQVSAVALGCLLPVIAGQAQVVTDDLIFEANANNDFNGSDGWDFTQPSIGATGTLVVTSLVAPLHNATLGGGGYFSAEPQYAGGSGPQQHFGGAISPANITDFTYEIWLRRRGDNSEGQIASFRKTINFVGNNFHLAMTTGGPPPGGQDDQLLDIDFRDRAGIREGNFDTIPLPMGEWRQMAITYQDVSATNAQDGVMNIYINGNQTPVWTETTNNVFLGGGGTADLAYVTTHTINDSEGDRGFLGDIAIIRIYTDVLTPEEVAQNFQADADKYGLGDSPPSPPEIAGATLTDQLGFVFTGEVTGLIYELECSDNGTNYVKTGALVRGNGAEQILYDPRGTPTQAFYRIVDDAP